VLIDYHLPPPERPAWEPDLVTCAWVVAAIATSVGCLVTGGFVSFLLLCAAVACGAEAISRALPYGSGLRDYRQ
jgi:isopentenyl diphosphate isomerase/L-lactate dehydrogenase-like FMN-dependent dehydrogenase